MSNVCTVSSATMTQTDQYPMEDLCSTFHKTLYKKLQRAETSWWYMWNGSTRKQETHIIAMLILCFIFPCYHGCSQSLFHYPLVFFSLPLVCILNRSKTEAKLNCMIKLRTQGTPFFYKNTYFFAQAGCSYFFSDFSLECSYPCS